MALPKDAHTEEMDSSEAERLALWRRARQRDQRDPAVGIIRQYREASPGEMEPAWWPCLCRATSDITHDCGTPSTAAPVPLRARGDDTGRPKVNSNIKCPLQVPKFEHFVPSWWYCMGEVVEPLMGAGLAGGSGSLEG